ncbi:MAG: ABC transporter substrate-binding protein [Cyanobacteria bacterium J06600_6]
MNISSNRYQKVAIAICLFFCSLLFVVSAGRFFHSQSAVYLAVAGPTDGENVSGLEMLQGIQLYLDRVNDEGGIKGKQIRLEVFDDQNKPETAVKVAGEIAKSTSALAVLGHLYSSTSFVAGEVYEQLGVPALTASATADLVTKDNDWYSRVIFNNRLQARFIANYTYQILERPHASVIYSDDEYGRTLTESFVNTFTSLGGTVTYQWVLDAESPDYPQQQQQIIEDVSALNQQQPEMIFCATHNDDVIDLIVKMKRQQLRYELIGADSLGNVAFAQKFQTYPEEEKNPGYFSDGIYAVAPIIFDIANENAQKFRNEYIRKYKSEPSWTAATYYDAAAVAIAAISKAQVTGEKANLTQERQRVKENLLQINSVANSVLGLSGQLYFDVEGNFDSSIYIGTFSQQKFISAFTQLQPLNNLETVDNLQAELDSGRVMLIDGKYRHRTNIVYTGIDIIAIPIAMRYTKLLQNNC